MDIVKTKRTILRRPTEADHSEFYKMCSDQETVRYTAYKTPQTKKQSHDRLSRLIENQTDLTPMGFWIAEELATKKFIGLFLIFKNDQAAWEFGYILSKEMWGQGFATECGRELVSKALNEYSLKQLLAQTDTINRASIRVLEKIGFELQENKSNEKELVFSLIQKH